MSREQKDERNRKQRERRRAQKGLADENAPNDNAPNENSPIFALEGNQDPCCTQTVELDPTERRKQRDRERYASMSREEKDERNRKQHERRQANKLMANQNAQMVRHAEVQDANANENELHLSSCIGDLNVDAGDRGKCTGAENRTTDDRNLALSSDQDNFVDIPLPSLHGCVGPKGQGDGDGGVNCGHGTCAEECITPMRQRDDHHLSSGNNDIINVEDGTGGNCTCPATQPTEERGTPTAYCG